MTITQTALEYIISDTSITTSNDIALIWIFLAVTAITGAFAFLSFLQSAPLKEMKDGDKAILAAFTGTMIGLFTILLTFALISIPTQESNNRNIELDGHRVQMMLENELGVTFQDDAVAQNVTAMITDMPETAETETISAPYMGEGETYLTSIKLTIDPKNGVITAEQAVNTKTIE